MSHGQLINSSSAPTRRRLRTVSGNCSGAERLCAYHGDRLPDSVTPFDQYSLAYSSARKTPVNLRLFMSKVPRHEEGTASEWRRGVLARPVDERQLTSRAVTSPNVRFFAVVCHRTPHNPTVKWGIANSSVLRVVPAWIFAIGCKTQCHLNLEAPKAQSTRKSAQ